MLMLRPVELAT